MKCDKCESDRILGVGAKCNDIWAVAFSGVSQVDYAPRDVGLGGGDYLDFQICLDCGKVQGDFPIEDPEVSQRDDEE